MLLCITTWSMVSAYTPRNTSVYLCLNMYTLSTHEYDTFISDLRLLILYRCNISLQNNGWDKDIRRENMHIYRYSMLDRCIVFSFQLKIQACAFSFLKCIKHMNHLCYCTWTPTICTRIVTGMTRLSLYWNIYHLRRNTVLFYLLS